MVIYLFVQHLVRKCICLFPPVSAKYPSERILVQHWCGYLFVYLVAFPPWLCIGHKTPYNIAVYTKQ